MRRIIDAEKFVRLWLAGASSSEIAKEMEMSVTHVGVYARQLRDKGVRLPSRKGAIDATLLNKIIDGE